MTDNRVIVQDDVFHRGMVTAALRDEALYTGSREIVLEAIWIVVIVLGVLLLNRFTGGGG
ncbi:MAG: hypothetical protein IT166_19120 [Bryobacterales bacterium]|nr:hypothetical protein [Bryobacterales bacterium]